MAGAALHYNDADLRRLELRLRDIGDMNTRQLFIELSAEGESQTRRRIQNEKRAPDGARWPAWSDDYAATRHGNQSLLQGEGDLLDSLTGFVYLDGKGAEWGSDLIYAATHQFGDPSRNINQREFLGINAENEDDLQDILDGFVRRQLGRLQ